MLFNIVEIHKCPACGKEFGFTEIYSHDHDNIREREVRYRPALCPACREKPTDDLGPVDGPGRGPSRRALTPPRRMPKITSK